MEIKVYGPGCARCAETESLVRAAAAAAGNNINVTTVSDLKEMMLAGIMSTPAVAVDGVVKSGGRIPGKEEVMDWIAQGSAAAGAGGAAVCACSGDSSGDSSGGCACGNSGDSSGPCSCGNSGGSFGGCACGGKC